MQVWAMQGVGLCPDCFHIARAILYRDPAARAWAAAWAAKLRGLIAAANMPPEDD